MFYLTDDCQWPCVKRDTEQNAAKDDLPGMCIHVTREHMLPFFFEANYGGPVGPAWTRYIAKEELCDYNTPKMGKKAQRPGERTAKRRAKSYMTGTSSIALNKIYLPKRLRGASKARGQQHNAGALLHSIQELGWRFWRFCTSRDSTIAQWGWWSEPSPRYSQAQVEHKATDTQPAKRKRR